MTLAFEKPLYILPFDHRGSFQEDSAGCVVAEIARPYRVGVDIFEKARISP